jgi:hypothetical protein
MKKLTAVRGKRSTLVTAAVVAGLAAMAPAALAVTEALPTGNGTIVGTTVNDTLTAGNGNVTVWGLGGLMNGSEVISVGNGNDVVDAGGTCPAGTPGAGAYAAGSASAILAANYCQHGPNLNPDVTNITVGTGSDTVYGNDGRNYIDAGDNQDIIYAYGEAGNYVNVAANVNNLATPGFGGDLIFAYYPGAYTVGASTTTNNVYDVYSPGSTVQCQDNKTTVFTIAQRNWATILGNCNVSYFASVQPRPSDPALKRHHRTHQR